MISMLFVAALPATQADPLPPYAESLRCAGLAEAAATLHAQYSPEWSRYWDAGVFWGFAAGEAARKDGISSARFKMDQAARRELAVAELALKDDRTEIELAACMARVEPVERGG